MTQSTQQQTKEVYTTPELVPQELLRDITADPTAYSN